MPTKKKAAKKNVYWAVGAPDGTIYHNWLSPYRAVLRGGYIGKYGYPPSKMKEKIVRVKVVKL